MARGPDDRPGIECLTGNTVDISEWLDFDFYWILTESGKVLARSTVQHVTLTDMATDEMKARVSTFDNRLTERLDDSNFVIPLPNGVFYLQDDDIDAVPDLTHTPPDEEYGDMLQRDRLEADETEFETFDKYIGAEFFVNNNGEYVLAKVLKRARGNDGNAMGKKHSNPLMDTSVYDCELGDGTVYCYSANVIAENIFSQCDYEGRRHAVLQEINK